MLIFLVPSRRLMTRVAAPKISGSGKREEVPAEILVELLGDVAGQLQMLLLVLAHRHMGRLIGQDVGRHQVGIDVEPDRGVLAVLARLLLELGHAVQPADPRHAVEDPGELGMGRHLALVEDDMLAGIDAGGQEGGRHLAGLARAAPPDPATG